MKLVTMSEFLTSLEGDSLQAFGARVSYAIDSIGISVPAFAQECVMSQSAMYKYVRGETEPSRAALITISKVSGYNLEWLLTGEGPRIKAEFQVHDYAALADSFHRYRAEIPRHIADDVVKEQFVGDYNTSASWVVQVPGMAQVNLQILEDALVLSVGMEGMSIQSGPVSNDLMLPSPAGRGFLGKFNRDSFGELGVSAFTAIAGDDAMAPLIIEGDVLVLSNLSGGVRKSELKDHGIYAFDAGEKQVLVRRVQLRVGDTHKIILLTEREADALGDGEVVDLRKTKLIGRVIGLARSMG